MKRLPTEKHYIVYPETIQGPKELNIDMRRKTRAGGSSHGETAIGGKPSLNANKLNSNTNPKIATSKAKTEV